MLSLLFLCAIVLQFAEWRARSLAHKSRVNSRVLNLRAVKKQLGVQSPKAEAV